VFTTLCATASTFGRLFIMRLGVGVGEASLQAPGVSLISDYFPRERLSRAMSVYSLGIFVGSGLAYLIGGWVVLGGGGMIGSNYSDALRVAGLTTPGKLLKQWDYTFGIGGPIKKDRLWYYVTARDEGQYRSIPNIYPNLNAGDPTKRLYSPDTTREVRGAESWRLYVVRLTYQASTRNKFNIHWDEQHPCNGSTFSQMSGAQDVVSHELSHAVTSCNSNLDYMKESGALNEAFSDMMGTSIEFFFQPPGNGDLKGDYLIGEDVFTIQFNRVRRKWDPEGRLKSAQSVRVLGDTA
jgi:hypothetical protein